MKEHLVFKDESTLDGEKVTEALCVMIIKDGNHFYLVSKDALKDE